MMPMLLAQTTLPVTIDQIETVVRAAGTRSWEAGALCLVMLGVMALLVWLVKTWMSQGYDREQRMALRLNLLENGQRTELTKLAVDTRESLDRNSVALVALTELLKSRPR